MESWRLRSSPFFSFEIFGLIFHNLLLLLDFVRIAPCNFVIIPRIQKRNHFQKSFGGVGSHVCLLWIKSDRQCHYLTVARLNLGKTQFVASLCTSRDFGMSQLTREFVVLFWFRRSLILTEFLWARCYEIASALLQLPFRCLNLFLFFLCGFVDEFHASKLQAWH